MDQIVSFLDNVFGARGTPIVLLFAAILVLVYVLIAPTLWRNWRKARVEGKPSPSSKWSLQTSGVRKAEGAGETQAAQILVTLARDRKTSAHVREQIAEALAKLGDSAQAAEILVSLEHDAKVRIEVREKAASSLRELRESH